MGKRIVILNGSPRRAGNTAALTAAFTKGAEEAGHTVTEFFLGELDIHGCRGCFGGSSGRDYPCVQRDGMETIYAEDVPTAGVGLAVMNRLLRAAAFRVVD